MVLLRCKCGYMWDYKGTSSYATCPRCLHKINVQKHKLIDEQEIDKWLIEQLQKAIEKYPEHAQEIEWIIETLTSPSLPTQKVTTRMFALSIIKNL